MNRFNWEEDMNEQLAQLKPSRWKVFQVLILKTENDGDEKRYCIYSCHLI